MKTKTIYYSVALLAFASLLAFTGCKKKKAFKNEDGQSSEDNRTIQSENDGAVSDANNVIASSSLKGKSEGMYDAKGVTGTLSDVVIDSANVGSGSIKLNFNGTTVNNRTRTGSIRLTILGYPAKKWKDAGTEMRVEFLEYKVTRASDGQYVILNGSEIVKNVSGTNWFHLFFTPSHPAVVTEVREDGGVNVTFSDGKTAQYNINRRVTYSWESGLIYRCTAEGTGNSDGLSNLENYGTTREGDAFTSQVTTPIVWNSTCGWWAPIAGAVNIKVAEKEFDLKCTFAVNTSGDPVEVAANQCAYGWKLEWSHKKKTNKKIFGYK